MNLLILLHVKSNHQAELAISILTKRGAFLRKEDINAPPLNRVIAVGACNDGLIHFFFKGMDSALPRSDITCHVYEESLLPPDVKQSIIYRFQKAAYIRSLKTKVKAFISSLNELKVDGMKESELQQLFVTLSKNKIHHKKSPE